MVNRVTDVGQIPPLTTRYAKALASLAIVSTLVLGAWSFAPSPTVAGGETRTLSMYHTHTKESITVTYMQDGRYIPSAMKKLNYFLRDWRRNEVTTIDPRSLDLVWELHADLKSKKPVHIVSGYRSPMTNAFLKRIGRNVAKRSQHMKGKAIDFYFPDVNTRNIRDSALPRRVGGVGYYRSSGGPSGFLHVDSGNVRTWGPAISKSQMAQIMRDGPKTIGARFKGKRTAAMMAVAESGSADAKKKASLMGWITGSDSEQVVEENVAPLESAYDAAGGELAALTAGAAQAPSPLDESVIEQVAEEDESNEGIASDESDNLANLTQTAAVEELAAKKPGAKKGLAALKPRLKPATVLALADATALSADVNVVPASAAPESQTFKKGPSPVADTLAALAEVQPTNPLYDGTALEDPVSNSEGKTSFAAELRDGTTEEAPLIEPLMASLDGGTLRVSAPSWWESLFMSDAEMLRRDGQPTSLDGDGGDVMPKAAILGPDGAGMATSSNQQTVAEGKGDALVVNREGKGSLETTELRLPGPTSISQLE